MTSPRIPPIPINEWREGTRDAMRALRVQNPRHPFPKPDPGRPRALNALGVLAHHPALTTAYHTFNGYVQFGTTITARQRELLVLRVAHGRGCEYEWLQHTVLAGDAGISEDEVARVGEGADAPGGRGWKLPSCAPPTSWWRMPTSPTRRGRGLAPSSTPSR